VGVGVASIRCLFNYRPINKSTGKVLWGQVLQSHISKQQAKRPNLFLGYDQVMGNRNRDWLEFDKKETPFGRFFSSCERL